MKKRSIQFLKESGKNLRHQLRPGLAMQVLCLLGLVEVNKVIKGYNP